MRIGIDATPLPPRPVGAGRYIIQLIRALVAQESPDQLIVFCQQSRAALLGLHPSPRLSLVILPDQSPPSRLVWEQTLFPRLAARHRLDLLHSLHYTLPIAYPGRRVVTFHDMTFFLFPRLHTLPKRYFFRLFIHLSARLADALIADSESTRQDAIRFTGVSPQKISTVLLGVTPEFRPLNDAQRLAQVRRKYNLPKHYLLYVGLIEPRKNVPALLQAFARIAPQIPDHSLVIAGRPGWHYDQFLQQYRQIGLQNRLHFTGYVAQEDLPAVYNMADCFVYPSTYEGFGLPVLEAMACGAPVITTNVSSMPEIVADAGILLPPQDVPGLAQAILRLIHSPQERRLLSEKGLQRAASFTWERTAAQTLAVYRRVLHPEPPAL